MDGYDCLEDIYRRVWQFKHIYGWVCLFRTYFFWGGYDCLKHFYGWVWLCEESVTGCTWVWVDVTGCKWVWVDVTGCRWVLLFKWNLWVYLFRIHLLVGVVVCDRLKHMGGCAFLEDIHGWMWLFRGYLSVSVPF